MVRRTQMWLHMALAVTISSGSIGTCWRVRACTTATSTTTTPTMTKIMTSMLIMTKNHDHDHGHARCKPRRTYISLRQFTSFKSFLLHSLPVATACWAPLSFDESRYARLTGTRRHPTNTARLASSIASRIQLRGPHRLCSTRGSSSA